ncbi:tyrosine-type recombinase/integrase, partial [Acetobacterium malicum]|nr:tyrosine-type recombinase/integrase [Acetobacterium malicum]
FLLVTGLRISELAGLTYDRVDLDNKKILIDRQLVSTKPVSFG